MLQSPDMQLVQAAMRKAAAGQDKAITPQERRAWRRWEFQEDERRGLRFLKAVPKKLYCEWSGRQTKTLHEQADRFGFPLRGATINLIDFIRQIHDWFADNKRQLGHLTRAPDSGTAASPKEQLVLEQIEVYRRRVILLEQKIAREEATLIPRSEVHALHIQLANVLRGAGEQLRKQFGDEAASILEVALDDFEATVAQLAKDEAAAADSDHAAAANDR